MSNFFTNFFGQISGAQPGSSSKGLNHKLLIPALLATSVSLYWQYSSFNACKQENFESNLKLMKHNEMKRIQRMISQIPIDINDLKSFTAPEIQAITRRNTIKNRLAGRFKRNFCSENLIENNKEHESNNFNLKNEESKNNTNSDEICISKLQTAQIEENQDSAKVGTSSILSTSSVVTISSESEQGYEGLAGILKKSLSNTKTLKRVSFAI